MDHVIQIVLASGSPRRSELLGSLGLHFDIIVSDVDENPHDCEVPEALALRLAESKACVVSQEYHESVIIAADTLVVIDNAVLGKPADEAQAVEMLQRLRGREHLVHTGLAVICQVRGIANIQLATTPVQMREYTNAEIFQYVATGNPMDKAGAYAIQSNAFQPVESIQQCYANVMGLPLCHLYNALASLELDIPVHPLQACPYALQKGGCEWSAAILEQARETRT